VIAAFDAAARRIELHAAKDVRAGIDLSAVR
jgi:hypothetical protein